MSAILRPALQIIDFVWIDPAALGLATSAEANVKNLLADAESNYVLVCAELNFSRILADQDRNKVHIIAITKRARLLKREVWVASLAAHALLSNWDVLYSSWLPRLCLCALLLPIKCRLFVHDLNIFRKRIYDAKFRQPSLLSRLHQYLCIKRATIVQCFARSVARQLKLLRNDDIPVVDQTVRIVSPADCVKRDGRAVMFLDERNYKGAWALDRFFSSTRNFRLTVIGKIDAASENLLKSRGIAVRALQPSNEDKFKLLAEADFVIFASKYEGYGLPPREAAALGTPSLIARRAALLGIPARLSLSIEDFGERIDLAEIAKLAGAIDGEAVKQWGARFLRPTSTFWGRHAPDQRAGRTAPSAPRIRTVG